MNQEEAELDVVSILTSLSEVVMKRAQDIQKSLEQERLEHFYCIRILDQIKSEISKRNNRVPYVEDRCTYKRAGAEKGSLWDYAMNELLY